LKAIAISKSISLPSSPDKTSQQNEWSGGPLEEVLCPKPNGADEGRQLKMLLQTKNLTLATQLAVPKTILQQTINYRFRFF
jgi:hypothetical protein